MAKKTVTADRYAQITHEAEAVAQMVQTEGWRVIKEELESQAEQIRALLTENRLRTITETITTSQGTKTFTTTAETQIAENAGMYKQIQQLFSTIETIIHAPERLTEMEEQGVVTVEKVDTSKKGGEER